VSAGNLPEQGLEYVRALREVKYQEAVFEIMAKQFELAKVDEAKDGGNVQQLDIAVPPERKSKPKKAIIVILSVLAAGFMAVLIAFMRAAMRNAASSEESQKGLLALKKAWGFKG
jgi:tyrosine-protein kinase Etk/Wzc